MKPAISNTHHVVNDAIVDKKWGTDFKGKGEKIIQSCQCIERHVFCCANLCNFVECMHTVFMNLFSCICVPKGPYSLNSLFTLDSSLCLLHFVALRMKKSQKNKN